jgi:hypothetical protein
LISFQMARICTRLPNYRPSYGDTALNSLAITAPPGSAASIGTCIN